MMPPRNSVESSAQKMVKIIHVIFALSVAAVFGTPAEPVALSDCAWSATGEGGRRARGGGICGVAVSYRRHNKPVIVIGAGDDLKINGANVPQRLGHAAYAFALRFGFDRE